MVTATISAPFPAGNVTSKALAIRLGPQAAFSFDTDRLRMAAAWTGPFLTPTGLVFNAAQATWPEVAGEQKFGTALVPGWTGAQGNFADPHLTDGPLPPAWGRWDGFYVVGNDVVLSYTVLGTKIYEQPSVVVKDGRTAFVRTFKLATLGQPLTLLVADVEGATVVRGDDSRTVLSGGGMATSIALVGAPLGARLEVRDQGRVVLLLPKATAPAPFKVVMFRGPAADQASFPALVADAPQMVEFKNGGPAHWPTPILTKGTLGKETGAYVVDRITTPFPGAFGPVSEAPADWKNNPFRRRIMFGGFDFFADGKRAALATFDGDIWIVSGLDADLQNLSWRRFASGGFELLGLKIVNETIYAVGRDQITRYRDLNSDGEADFYENFNNQVAVSTGFHAFQMDLQTDGGGNFYTATATPVRAGGHGYGGGAGNGTPTRFSGTLQKISKDGKTREIVARGFRSPNGIGIGPRGEVTMGDDDGNWAPACSIYWIRKNGFYGVPMQSQENSRPEPPLCWLARTFDNSPAGQVWVTSDRWGPLKGELLHLSYGKAVIYRVLRQHIGTTAQGGVVRMIGGTDGAPYTNEPAKLTSSAMRGRFNPVDGQLYVAGLRAWQTDAGALTGFDRIRYTGKPVDTVTGLRVFRGGVELDFSHPLDPSAADPQKFSVERWNYQRSEDYGSPEFSVTNPTRQGHDTMPIAGASLSADGRRVTLKLDDVRPAHQMLVKFKVKTRDGKEITQSILQTVHVVP